METRKEKGPAEIARALPPLSRIRVLDRVRTGDASGLSPEEAGVLGLIIKAMDREKAERKKTPRTPRPRKKTALEEKPPKGVFCASKFQREGTRVKALMRAYDEKYGLRQPSPKRKKAKPKKKSNGANKPKPGVSAVEQAGPMTKERYRKLLNHRRWRARQRRWNDKAREGYEIGMKAWSETSKFGI